MRMISCRIQIVWVLLLCIGVLGCGPGPHTRTKVGTSTDGKGKEVVILRGTIHLVPLEGGCWKISLDEQTAYGLVGQNLGEVFRDGQVAEIEVRWSGNISTICMMGEVVELVRVVKLYE